MIAYDTYCKQRLLEWKRRKKPKARFAEDDVIDALQSIADAIDMASAIIDEGEAAHFDIFVSQLIEWGIDPLTFTAEPYLEEVKVNFAYQFVREMDTLFVRVETYLQDINGTRSKAGISFYSAEGAKIQSLDASMEWKIFTSKEPLVNQVNQSILLEGERVQRRLQRNLDARRQHAAGVLAYT